MANYEKLYINGQWQAADTDEQIVVLNPATGEPVGQVPSASPADAEKAILSARAAFDGWAQLSQAERLSYVEKIHEGLVARQEELAQVVSAELGAPITFARRVQAGLPVADFGSFIEVAKSLDLDSPEKVGHSEVYREPIGVCSFITPWNYPLHQIAAKVAPAMIAGCTMVLKPSSETPLNAFVFAEIVHEAGVPAGVFNLVSGPGRTVGELLASHDEVDMISITGSTESGARVAQLAAPGIKRVTQELGGKSALILLDDCPFETAVPTAVKGVMSNSGQTCAALTRMLVPRAELDRVVALAKEAAESVVVGDPADEATEMGSMVSKGQRNTVLGYIDRGLAEGATLVCGGTELPSSVQKGAFVQPTIFADVDNSMTIAQEEIFGPVLSIIAYDSEDEAVEIANNTLYGLSGGVWSADADRARGVARKLRTGQVGINGGRFNPFAPFGGYKRSGNGRELGGKLGLDEFLELKTVNF